MATFTPGGIQTPTNATFMSTYDMINLDKSGALVKPFGTGRLTGLLELFGMKEKSTSSIYYWYEKDRIMPKIKATNGGAGAAGAAVTFTLNAASEVTYNYGTPSQYNASAVTKDNVPVRVNDIIAIKPASGTVSASTLVKAIVRSVNAAAGTFVAYPLKSSDSIPNVSSADEIIIFSNAHGEGSVMPEGLATRTTQRNNNTQIFKENYEITGTAKALRTYFTVDGKDYYWMDAEQDTYNRFLNYREMGLLYNSKMDNSVMQGLYASDGTPIATTEGLITSVLDRGNTYNYSSVTGLTIADMEEIVITLDTQKGAKRNTMLMGLELDLQMDRELRDQFKNGGINYGTFSMDENKAVGLGFTTFKLSSYIFDKKCLDAFNDLQTFGASGFNFNKEALVLPGEKVADGEGIKQNPVSMRYLETPGENREMMTTPVDLRKVGDTGKDVLQMRYQSEVGLQTVAANLMTYIKLA